MEEDKGKDDAEDWKVYEALCSKTPTEVSANCNIRKPEKKPQIFPFVSVVNIIVGTIDTYRIV
jgi:hypothetical protein